MYNLEATLRALIERRLSTVSGYWWDECVPWETRRKVEKRARKGELAPWHRIESVRLSDIYYLGIEDYMDIITQPNNWKKVFERIFHEQDRICSRLEKLKKIRNKVMHFHPITPKEKVLLEKYVEEILTLIGNWESINNRYVDTAREAFLSGNVHEALRILNEGLRQTVSEENPQGDPWVAYWMGWMLQELENYDEAVTWYRYTVERLLPRYKRMAEERLLKIEKKKEPIAAICPNCGHRFEVRKGSN